MSNTAPHYESPKVEQIDTEGLPLSTSPGTFTGPA